jgi:hypothetical protein
MGNLDELMARLAAQPTDRPLDQLEPAVWARIEARAGDHPDWALLAPLRLATLSLALVTGIAVGGAAAASAVRQPHEASLFTAEADLAPSTLLEGRRS